MDYAKNQFTLTDGAMCLIEDIVQEKKTTDRKAICAGVCAKLEERYGGDALEFHLEHMHLATTAEILRAIDIYFIMRSEFPDYSFRRGKGKKSQKADDKDAA